MNSPKSSWYTITDCLRNLPSVSVGLDSTIFKYNKRAVVIATALYPLIILFWKVLILTQQELTQLNLGQGLDDIANIDPRGYGVCKILYSASRSYTGYPLSMNAAKKLDAKEIP